VYRPPEIEPSNKKGPLPIAFHGSNVGEVGLSDIMDGYPGYSHIGKASEYQEKSASTCPLIRVLA